MAKGASDLLQMFANPTNRQILSILALEPQYPRRLAELVGLTEDEASRRLRSFEKMGLAEADWANLGKTVRLYRLASANFTVSVTPNGLAVSGIRGDKPLSLGAVSESPPALQRFLGRASELAALRSVLETRRAVCLTGIGGAGKTTLAAAFAQSLGVPVSWHTVPPAESGTLLLGRLASNLRALESGDRAARLMSLSASEDSAALVAAIAGALDAHGAILVIDRFEAAAPGAGDAVADLARRLERGALVVTSRSFPREFPRDAVANLPVGGLPREDAESLLAALGAPAAACVALAERTRGHALSLVLVALAAASGRDASAEALVEESGVREFFLTDVLPQLPEPERDAVYALSLLRDPFTAHEAEAVTGSKHARDVLLRLEARGLAQRMGDSFALHDLVRSFASNAAPEAKRVHARAAAVLAEAGEPAKALEAVHHWVAAGKLDEAAAIVEEEATRRSYRFVDLGFRERYVEALRELETAPKLAREPRAAVDLEIGVIETFAGNEAAARAHLDSAAAAIGKRSPLALPLLLANARVLRLAGRVQEASTRYAEVEALAAQQKESRLLLEALIDHGFTAEEYSDKEALAAFTKAIDVGVETSDVRLLSLAYSGAARITGREGRAENLALAEEALRLARLAGYLRGEASVYMTLTTHAMMVGEVESGSRYAERYLDVATRLGDPWLRACALNDVAFFHISRRNWTEAASSARAARALAESLNSDFYRLGSVMALGEIAVAEGRFDDVERELAALVAKYDDAKAWPGFVARAWGIIGRAARARGDVARAEHAEARAASIRVAREIESTYLSDPRIYHPDPTGGDTS